MKSDVKKVCIFHLILVVVLSILLLSVKNSGSEREGECKKKKKIVNRDKIYLSTLPKIRISAHKFLIETGRHEDILKTLVMTSATTL